jgi:putative peptide zinc metalloprotease protein
MNAASAACADSAESTLPALRQELKLFPGPALADGSRCWRIQDPARNRFFQIGWLDFELLSRWRQGGRCDELIARTARETTLAPSVEEVGALVEFLSQNQLTAAASGAEREDLRRRWRSAQRPWYETLLHHYLFFRIPLLRPDAWLARAAAKLAWMFTPAFAAVLAALLAADAYLVMRQWHDFERQFLYFFNPEGLLWYAAAATFAKLVHEFGHALTAKRLGLRIPHMGVAFLVLWPMLYTDTGEAWMLADARGRFRIVAAGIAAELGLALVATFAWALAAEGPWRSALFALATATWILTLSINASPFMRFDGYYLLSDAIDMPNLHERSGALARWWLRTRLFRLRLAQPEPLLSVSRRRTLIAFALATWLYRLALFFAIALLVYHLFFKLLGLLLMLIELGWFVARPIASEGRFLWRARARLRPAPFPLATLGLMLGLLLWLWPLTAQVTAPALLRAEHVFAAHSPVPARIAQILVSPGQRVAAGQILVRLESPDFAHQLDRARIRAASLETELERSGASARRLERRAVLENELRTVQADLNDAADERTRLELKAPFAGQVTDLAPDMVAGRWVAASQPLLRVVSPESQLIDVYVTEAQLPAVKVGQALRFWLNSAEGGVRAGTVVAVDPAAIKQVPHLLLASTFGGDLPAHANPARTRLISHEALYRVTAAVDSGGGALMPLQRSTARIATDWRVVSDTMLARLMATVVRESGF